MAFPGDDLVYGEHVVASTHPHWSRLAVPALVAPVLLAVAVVGVFVVPSWPIQDIIQYIIIIIFIALFVRFSVLPWLSWVTTRYALTTERLIVQEGILNRFRRDIPLVRIEGASVHSTATERLFGCGTLVVSGAAERGPLELASVPKVEDVHAQMYQLAEDAAHRRHGG